MWVLENFRFLSIKIIYKVFDLEIQENRMLVLENLRLLSSYKPNTLCKHLLGFNKIRSSTPGKIMDFLKITRLNKEL